MKHYFIIHNLNFNLIVANLTEIQALQWQKEITSPEQMENSYLVVKKCKYKAGHE